MVLGIKKIKILIAILTVFAVFMGTGYAAWADQLNVGGTVATGEVNVIFTTSMLAVPVTDPAGLLSGNARICEEGKKVEFTLDNLYPGCPAFRLHTVKKNAGSIPVRLNSATLSFDDPQNPVIDYLEAKVDASFCKNPGGTVYAVSDITEEWFPLVELDDRINASAQLLAAVLEPGGWISLGTVDENGEPQCLRFRLREDAPNDTQGRTVVLTLEMDFIQWNQ